MSGTARPSRPPSSLSSRAAVCAALIALAVAACAVALVSGRGALAAAPGRPAGASPLLTETATSTPTPQCGVAWNTVASPNAPTFGTSDLFGVAAISRDDAWAVGYFTTTDGLQHTLIERWDGRDWNIVPSPQPDLGGLYGISAVSANDIWAVGYEGLFPGPYRTITLHWNGAAWSEVPCPNPGSGAQLVGVSARAPDDVWAVGLQFNLNTFQTLAVHWIGAAWSVVPSPNEATNSDLAGVLALAPDNAWAVGGYVNSSRQYVSTIQHWNGTAWSTAPNPGTPGYLYSLAAAGPGDVWAVGYRNNAGQFQTLATHWDGVAWSVRPSPNPGQPYNFLYGVSALASNDVWAVGRGNGTMALHWDGEQWSLSPSPNPPGGGGFSAVAARTSGDVWAVGEYYDIVNWVYGTLIERYADPCVVGTPTSSPTATATVVPSQTFTPVATFTIIPTSTSTATFTPCPMTFTDVQPSDYFYEAVRYLYCHGAVSGYADGTFRPYNNTTRGQLSKITVLAEGWTINTSGGPHFSDVLPGSTFYDYIETAYNRGIISGYADGTFRPGANVTRGQLCKIVVLAEGWAINTTGGPHFSDVLPGSTFYDWIETAFNHAIISGYADGTFRPGNNATRGQICKIVYSAVRQGAIR